MLFDGENRMPSISAALATHPFGKFVMFLALVVLGLQGTRSREVAIGRALPMPLLLFIGWGVYAGLQALACPEMLIWWGTALAAAAVVSWFQSGLTELD